MKSLPTIDQLNEERFLQIVRQFNPELYLIHVALRETGVNPLILPKIIRSIGNLTFGTGFGKIQIFMHQFTITQIKGEESVEVQEKASVE